MKLSAEQIKSVAVGVAYVSQNNEDVELHRFTKEQEEFYKTVNDDFYKKCFATSGVRIDLTTDSRILELEVEVSSGSSRKYFCHSIFVDGKRYASLEARTDTGVFGGKWTLPEGEKRVTIYFPWSVRSTIRSLSLDDGATLIPVKKSIKMISFGDSITHGYDASSPELSYASRLADAIDANSRNKGIGAEIFRPALAELYDGFEPDVITVAYGTNDWSACEDRETLTRNCRDFYTALSNNYPNAKIFAITPIWRKDWLKVKPMGKFFVPTDIIENVAESIPNVTAINAIGFIPQDLSCFSPDGIHPCDKGFEHYSEGIIEEIKKHL